MVCIQVLSLYYIERLNATASGTDFRDGTGDVDNCIHLPFYRYTDYTHTVAAYLAVAVREFLVRVTCVDFRPGRVTLLNFIKYSQ